MEWISDKWLADTPTFSSIASSDEGTAGSHASKRYCPNSGNMVRESVGITESSCWRPGISNHAHLRIALPIYRRKEFVLAAGYFEPCSFTNCAPARHAGAKAVQVLKANSSRWLGEH